MVDAVDPGLKTKMEISSRGDTQKRMEAEAVVLMIGRQGHSSCLKQGEVRGASAEGQEGKELTLPGQHFFWIQIKS